MSDLASLKTVKKAVARIFDRRMHFYDVSREVHVLPPRSKVLQFYSLFITSATTHPF